MSDCSDFGKNVVIYGVSNSSSQHADNRNIYIYIYIYIYIFILVKDPADGLNNTVTAEGEFSINFSEQQNIFC